ncbi:MAG: carbamoyltransferase HypF, partial [Acidobacteriota bacterium]
MTERRRIRARVTGVVQGVGFRPLVYRLACSLELGGHVLNDTRGVLLEVEGHEQAVSSFLDRLRSESPPLAEIEDVRVESLAPQGETSFQIVASEDAGPPDALITPDTSTCDDCLSELFDPDDRRHRYPFINCTNCGPRFTIVRGVPYDRPLTTMADFEMCGPCRREYENPADRRFHAQPNACSDCGPSVRLLDEEGEREAEEDAAILAAAAALVDGRIVAVKGLGGFHLACRADDEDATARLRGRKHREDKPFALMVADPTAARSLVHLGAEEEALLTGRERPIVLARRRSGSVVAPSVAPRHRNLGVMLPYSPLHHLLLREAAVPLVMTSGNVSDEPIVYRNRDALARLSGLADRFLSNDRPIHMRTDDSVVRIVDLPEGPRMLMLRRSRGWVPTPIGLPSGEDVPELLACGAHLKNTFS